MNYLSKTIIFSLALLSTSHLLAHSMWLDKTGYGYDLSYGEKGSVDLYNPQRVSKILGYNDKNEKKNIDILRYELKEKKGLARIYIKKNYSLLYAELDNKYWFHTKDDKWHNIPKNEKPKDIIEEGQSYKSTKHIIKWEKYMLKPIGQKVEIVPLQNPSSLKEGQFLVVKLYINGMPMLSEGIKIAIDSNPYIDHSLIHLKADETIRIRISKPGLQLINVKYKVKLTGKKVIWYSSTLTFNTK